MLPWPAMLCGQCGEPVLEGAHFCGQCGARQDAPPPAAPPPAPPLPAEAIPEPPNATAKTVHDDEGRNPKTAPMLQMPEFDGPGGASGGVRPTLPMAEGQARVHARPEVARPPPQLARRLAWSTLGLVACAGLALLIVGVRGGGFAPWRSETPPEPSAVWLPSPEGQGGTEAVATPPAEEPEVSASPEPERPPAQSPRGSSPTPPKPAPSAPPKPAPSVPPLPAPPAPPLPTPPLPTTPTPAPPAPLPSLPQLPWTLPTAGACERCVQALRGTGHYIVVTAVTEALLCEDRAAREGCEREIAEVAPEVAERAAREGNCTAALATVAAAVNVRVGPERFGAVNALCLR